MYQGKVEQSKERSSTFLSVAAIEKRAFWSPSTTVAKNNNISSKEIILSEQILLGVILLLISTGSEFCDYN